MNPREGNDVFRAKGEAMRTSDITPGTVREIWSACGPRIGLSPWLDEVASVVVDALYDRFADSLVMARAFLTVPFKALPKRQEDFASELARSVGLEAMLGPATPVHSLLASRGCEQDWNDPRRSRSHVAIPLLSEAFVASIPMMSRLLKELGLPLTWVQDPGAVMSRQTLGSETGFFYVEDARRAVDEQGRKIIAAQDFVSRHGVRCVFAVGGVAFGGAVLVLIFFSRDPVDSRAVRSFMPLVNLLKATLISRCSMSRVFKPDGEPFDRSAADGGTP